MQNGAELGLIHCSELAAKVRVCSKMFEDWGVNIRLVSFDDRLVKRNHGSSLTKVDLAMSILAFRLIDR